MEKMLESVSKALGNFFSMYILPVTTTVIILILSNVATKVSFNTTESAILDVLRIGIITIMISVTVPDLTFFIKKDKKRRSNQYKSFSIAMLGLAISTIIIYLLWDKAFLNQKITIWQALVVEIAPRIGIAIRKFFLIINGKKIANELDEAYMDGYDDGHDDGYTKGKNDGFALGKKSSYRRQLLPPGDE